MAIRSSRRCKLIDHNKIDNTTDHYFLVCPGVSLSGFYRQATSIGAFESREADRIWKADEKGKTIQWCGVYRADDRIRDWEFHAELDEEYELDMDDHIPKSFIRVEGLWDFYKLIGYDYKAKKYIKRINHARSN